MNEPWRLSAAQLTAGYAKQLFTPLDALQACLTRTEVCEPSLNAFVALDREGARRAAASSAARWDTGRPLGPLDGVPVSVKDNMHVAGLPTSWGSRLLQGFVASHDELPVARLRAAGAVLFGKSNLPEFAMQGYTSNALHGTTRNPWDTALTPGGSSGGAAAAVAAGLGPLALATDGGGSIRRPASHCGLVGFKPSRGLVRRERGLPEIFLDYEVAGGIGRCVKDVQHLTEAIAGSRLEAGRPSPSRILFVPRFGTHAVDPNIAASVRRAAEGFAALGHAVDEAQQQVNWSEAINALWPTLSNAGLAWMLQRAWQWPEFGLPEGVHPDLSRCGAVAQANFDAGLKLDASGLFDVLAEVRELERQMEVVFARYDFILTPATAALPWPCEQSHPERIADTEVGPRGHAVFTAFANAAGLPAIALPSAHAEGLPTGIQLVASAGHDAELLALTMQYEEAFPWPALWDEGFHSTG
jgi:aspartyl-tRNA(Asn)/glutamyl-tRNA(Gln) amidotransferase subunit A